MTDIASAYNQALSANRPLMMGVAILLIVVRHIYSVSPYNAYNFGDCGVDIFLFLSGWGLCHSYKNNSLSTFYYKRFTRIIPLFMFLNIIAEIIMGGGITQILLDISTYSYFTKPARVEWYLTSLIFLYLFFPLLFRITNELRHYTFCLFVIPWVVVLSFPNLFWQHHLFICRIPVFVLGIAAYFGCIVNKRFALLLCLIAPIVWWRVDRFIGYGLALPSIIYCFNKLSVHAGTKTRRFLEFCGKYSLEIYCANGIAQKIQLNYVNELGCANSIALYIILNIVFSYLFILTNKLFKNIIPPQLPKTTSTLCKQSQS